MISFIRNLPALQVGQHHVTGYDTIWIRQALVQAARRAGREQFPFIDDIYEGVVSYLECKCPLRLLKLEDLYLRIEYMLKTIGYETIAQALAPIAPPITISLEHVATKASSGFELAFYTELTKELRELKDIGVQDVYFSQVRESVCILLQAQQWDGQCQQLENELLQFLTKVGTTPTRQGSRIRLMITKNSLLDS